MEPLPRYLDDLDLDRLDLPEPEVAGAASPPRRPPTAIGLDEPGSSGDDSASVDELLQTMVEAMRMPLHDLGLSADVRQRLHSMGVGSLGQLLALSAQRFEELGVDESTRERLQMWRSEVGWTG